MFCFGGVRRLTLSLVCKLVQISSQEKLQRLAVYLKNHARISLIVSFQLKQNHRTWYILNKKRGMDLGEARPIMRLLPSKEKGRVDRDRKIGERGRKTLRAGQESWWNTMRVDEYFWLILDKKTILKSSYFLRTCIKRKKNLRCKKRCSEYHNKIKLTNKQTCSRLPGKEWEPACLRTFLQLPKETEGKKSVPRRVRNFSSGLGADEKCK